MMKTIKVSQKGQIAIPSEIRDSMGIKQGDELIMIQSGDKLLIQKSNSAQKNLEDDFKDIIKLNDASLKSVWNNKSDDIWATYLKPKKLS